MNDLTPNCSANYGTANAASLKRQTGYTQQWSCCVLKSIAVRKENQCHKKNRTRSYKNKMLL